MQILKRSRKNAESCWHIVGVRIAPLYFSSWNTVTWGRPIVVTVLRSTSVWPNNMFVRMLESHSFMKAKQPVPAICLYDNEVLSS